jgi:hypothetical protein
MKRYSIGFTRPALLKETTVIAQLYKEFRDWAKIKTSVNKENLLQTRTKRSSEIIFAEIQKRLSLLSTEQIELIAEDFPQDVRQLVWVALCKQYAFIGDFTLEVLTPAFMSGRQDINHDDYSYFFSSKADWHPELENVSDKTRSNARQALFQMMRQCELITEENRLIPQFLSSSIQQSSTEADLAYIPGAIRL